MVVGHSSLGRASTYYYTQPWANSPVTDPHPLSLPLLWLGMASFTEAMVPVHPSASKVLRTEVQLGSEWTHQSTVHGGFSMGKPRREVKRERGGFEHGRESYLADYLGELGFRWSSWDRPGCDVSAVEYILCARIPNAIWEGGICPHRDWLTAF